MNDAHLTTPARAGVEPSSSPHLQAISEGLILGICGIAPWLFGSVDAWAEFAIAVVIVVITAVGIVLQARARCVKLSIPSFIFACLVIYGISQQLSIPALNSSVWPSGTSGEQIALTPATAESLIGGDLPPVSLPKASISICPEATRLAVARLAAGWLLFEAVMRLGSPFASLRRFSIMTVVNSCLLSVYSLIQWLTWNGKIYWFRPAAHPDLAWYSGGPFMCHNHLAAYLNIGLGCSVGVLLTSLKRETLPGEPRGRRFWPALLSGLILMGLIVSHSRGGLLAAIVSLFLMFSTQKLRLGWSIFAFVFLGLTAVSALMATGSDSPWSRFSTLSESSQDVRWDVWRVAVKAWRQRPFLGYGLGTFGAAVTPFTDKDVHAVYQRAEDEYLDILVEGGLVGSGLGLALLGLLLFAGWRSIRRSNVLKERLFLTGGFFGGVALLLHWLTDFSFHMPGVAVSAIVLGGLFCRLGLERDEVAAFVVRRRFFSGFVAAVIPALICAAILIPAVRNAQAEVILWRAGLPLPDTQAPTPGPPESSPGEIRDRLEALRVALRYRPDWPEGHLRCGLLYVELYQSTATLWLKESQPDLNANQLTNLSDPLWLRLQVIQAMKKESFTSEMILSQDPVRECLIPAARAFLEARRCGRAGASTHAQLAQLSFLLKNGDPSEVYVNRALALAGADRSTLTFCALIAQQDGEQKTAAYSWRRVLEAEPAGWEPVANVVSLNLPAELVLSDVIPPDHGRLALLFATQISHHSAASREILLNGALQRIPYDVTLTPGEVKQLTALAQDALGHREEALNSLVKALEIDPKETPWRLILIQWLIQNKNWNEARLQANIGLGFDPSNIWLERSRQVAIDRIAHGEP